MKLLDFDYIDEKSKDICNQFISSNKKKFVLGRNKWRVSMKPSCILFQRINKKGDNCDK